MTISDATQIVTVVVLVTNMLISLRNNRHIREVKAATNGMKTELVNEVRAAALAKGKAEEKANPS